MSCHKAALLLLFVTFGTNASTQTPNDQFFFERSLTQLRRLGSEVMTQRQADSSDEQLEKEYSTAYSKLFSPRQTANWSCMMNSVIDFATTTDVRFKKFPRNDIGILCTHSSKGASTTTYMLLIPNTEQFQQVFNFTEEIVFDGAFIDEAQRVKLLPNPWAQEDLTDLFDYIVIKASSVRSLSGGVASKGDEKPDDQLLFEGQMKDLMTSIWRPEQGGNAIRQQQLEILKMKQVATLLAKNNKVIDGWACEYSDINISSDIIAITCISWGLDLFNFRYRLELPNIEQNQEMAAQLSSHTRIRFKGELIIKVDTLDHSIVPVTNGQVTEIISRN